MGALNALVIIRLADAVGYSTRLVICATQIEAIEQVSACSTDRGVQFGKNFAKIGIISMLTLDTTHGIWRNRRIGAE